MAQITNSPGPLFESSDEAASDHTYKSEHRPALPGATVNTSQVNNICNPDKSMECDVTAQLPDTTLMQEATNHAQCDATSTDTYELPDETTVSISDINCLPDATNSSTSKWLDKTSSSLPLVKLLPEATTSQLPDITVMQVIRDEAETINQMEFEATVEYPASVNVNESAPVMANTPVKTNIININTPVTSDTAENADNLLL